MAQPLLVGADPVGQVGRQVADKVQPFCVAFTLTISTTVRRNLAKLDVSEIELHLAGFDLGEIQDVVDEHQQMFAALLDDVQTRDLPVAQRLVALKIWA